MSHHRIHLFAILVAGVLTSCVPKAEKAGCGSGLSFNPTTRACVVDSSTGTNNGVSISAKIPLDAYTVLDGDTSATTHAITIADPYNVGYAIRWKVYPPPPGTPINLTSNVTSVNVIPSTHFTFGTGTYVVEANVLNPDTYDVVSSATWIVTDTDEANPVLSIDTSGSNLGSTTTNRLTSDTASQDFGVLITNPGGISCKITWYFDGHPTVVGGSVCPATSDAETFFVAGGFAYDNSPITSGLHTVKAEIKHGTTGDVFDTFEWYVFVSSPSLTTLSGGLYAPSPVTGSTVSVIDGTPLNANGFYLTGGTPINPASGNNDFCVAVTNYLGSDGSSGVLLQFYLNGAPITNISSNEFPGDNTFLCLGDINLTYTLSLANANVGESKTLSAAIIDVATGNIAEALSWTLSITPKNTKPVALIDDSLDLNVDGDLTGDTIECEQDDDCIFYITHTDSDYSASTGLKRMSDTGTEFEIRYSIDGVLLNGANLYPNTNVATDDCHHTSGGGGAYNVRRQCTLQIPSYDVNGRRLASTYTISAVVKDLVTNGAAIMTSDPVTWDLATTNAQTAPVGLGSSFIALDSSPNVSIGTATEGNTIVLQLKAQDAERDDLQFKVDKCEYSGGACIGPTTNVIPFTTVTKNDDVLTTTGTFSYTLPEDTITEITNAASGQIRFTISITDVPPVGSGITAAVATDIYEYLTVNNRNPFPVPTSPANYSPSTLGATYNVVTGYPLTLYGGTFTDASTSTTDFGENILYQWQLSSNGGTTWQNIVGATTTTLSWTAKQGDAGSFQFRLCFGDDGWDAPASTNDSILECTTDGNTTPPSLPATTRLIGPWTAVVAKSNETAVNTGSTYTGYQSGIAVWKDTASSTTGTDVYTAHIADDALAPTASKIVINKVNYALNGAITTSTAIEIDTEEPNVSSPSSIINKARDISIIGRTETVTNGGVTKKYKSLYLSYVTEQVSAPVPPQLRVRRIDITDGRFEFDYYGVIVDPTEGGTPFIITQDATDPTEVDITVSTVPTVGKYIDIYGIKLVAGNVTAPGSCSYTASGATVGTYDVQSNNTTTIAANIMSVLDSCYNAGSGDPRADITTMGGSAAANLITYTNFPLVWLDLSFLITKAGSIMTTPNGELIVPFIDGLNGNKVSVLGINTLTDYASGALIDADYSYTQLTTSAATELVNSMDVSQPTNPIKFDFSILTGGVTVKSYRYTFTDSSTINGAITNSNVFGASFFPTNIRMTTGRLAYNNFIYVAAQDSTSVSEDLVLARLNPTTLVNGISPSHLSPVFDQSYYNIVTPDDPTDSINNPSRHLQVAYLDDYQIHALKTSGEVMLAALTNDQIAEADLVAYENNVLVAKIKPVTTGSTSYEVNPLFSSVVSLEDGVLSTLNKVAWSPSDDALQIGDYGSSTNNTGNIREALFLVYPDGAAGAGTLKMSLINTQSQTFKGTTTGLQEGYVQ